MKYSNTIYLFVLLSLTGCGGGSKKESIFKLSNEAIPVYNHAYQENFEADNIEQIVRDAKNAYVLLDTFDQVTNEDISNIKVNHNQVGGYISAGTGENYRDDFADVEPYLATTPWAEFPDEFYVSETTTGILLVMQARIDKMATSGLDWVEFDNMDWLDTETKRTYNLSVTQAEAKTYINALCDYTQSKGMKCMAKNTVEGFESFDGVLYESFSKEKNWWDNEGTKLFLNAGKLVIINHYNETDCDGVYAEYQAFYKSENISFICEDVATQKYKHYNQ
jgi:hypothetical protein